MSDMKERISITLRKDLLDWINKEVAQLRFASRSHAIEFCIQECKKREHEK